MDGDLDLFNMIEETEYVIRTYSSGKVFEDYIGDIETYCGDVFLFIEDEYENEGRWSYFTIQRLDGKPFKKKEKKDIITLQIENFMDFNLPLIVQTYANKRLYITLDFDAEEWSESMYQQLFAFLSDASLKDIFAEDRIKELKEKYGKTSKYIPPEHYYYHGFEGFNTEETPEYTLF